MTADLECQDNLDIGLDLLMIVVWLWTETATIMIQSVSCWFLDNKGYSDQRKVYQIRLMGRYYSYLFHWKIQLEKNPLFQTTLSIVSVAYTKTSIYEWKLRIMKLLYVMHIYQNKSHNLYLNIQIWEAILLWNLRSWWWI